MSVEISKQVTCAITDWLKQEIVNADEGRNGYLSDYQDRRNDLSKPFSDPSNFVAQKTKGHYDRFVEWVRPYKEIGVRKDDWFAARLTFGCLMEISGSYRKQCYFQAEDEEDYLRRRYERSVGIDVRRVVSDELDPLKLTAIAEMSEDERLDYIIERSLRVNDAGFDLHSLAHSWTIDHQNTNGQLAAPEDVPVIAMQEAQKLWTGLATAHIAVAASLRDGDCSRVPFLEPESITDVIEVIYPLAA